MNSSYIILMIIKQSDMNILIYLSWLIIMCFLISVYIILLYNPIFAPDYTIPNLS